MSRPVRDTVAESFETLLEGSSQLDPADVYEQLRGHPVFFSERANAWVFGRYADVREILRDGRRFEVLGRGAGSSIHGRTVLQMTGAEHAKKVSLIARHIRHREALASLIPAIGEIAARLVDALPECPEQVDLSDALSTAVPAEVTARLLDVPEAERLREWTAALSGAGAGNATGDPDAYARGFRARDEVFAFIDALLPERRAGDRTDLLSALCTFRYRDQQLDDNEIKAFTSFLLTAGVETTARAITSLLAHLLSHPQTLAALRRNPSGSVAAVAESVRLYPPVQALFRQATVDTTVGRTRVAGGDRLLLLLASANQDERVYSNPRSFDLDRFADRPDRQFMGAGGTMLSFGAGSHLCTGSLLALREIVAVLERILASVDSVVFADGEPPRHQGFVLRSPESLRVKIRRHSATGNAT